MAPKYIDVYIILGIEAVLLLLFGIFAIYDEKYEADCDQYAMFQDVHTMIFVGFGYLMTFLRRYSFSGLGFNFLLAALIVQWACICQGFYNLNQEYKIPLSIQSLYRADIASASVLISMGAVLGKTSYMQLIIMGILEIAVYSGNTYLGNNVFKVADAGGSIFVHAFGAYYGLAVSYVLSRKNKVAQGEKSLEGSRYTSDLFAMIGTIFLWIFWPSFNAIELEGDEKHRAVINTYLSLASCCVTTFAFSLFLNPDHKFDMVYIQNSTLAGGVAVGAVANLMIEPFGAVLIGTAAAIISVYGYAKLTEFLRTTMNIPDTCGVHNLHGMPAVLAGLVGVLMAGIANESAYYKTLYKVYPARSGPTTDPNPEFGFIEAGDGRTAAQQAGYQALALVITLALAILSGLITGILLSCKIFKCGDPKSFYSDATYWTLPDSHRNDFFGKLEQPRTTSSTEEDPNQTRKV